MSQTDILALLRSLRHDHPAAEVVTEHIRIDERTAVFKATIRVPEGGVSTGHGSSDRSEIDDYIERAETKALIRALGVLGYLASDAESPVPDRRESAPTPVSITPNSSQPTRAEARPAEIETNDPEPRSPSRTSTRPDDSPSTAPTPIPNRASPDRRQSSATTRPTPVEIGSARERTAPSPTPFPNQSASAGSQRSSAAPNTSSDAGDQPPLEDYSWTAFWKWAREQGYESKGGIEAFIGRQMNNLNPAEVRQLIVAKRGGG